MANRKIDILDSEIAFDILLHICAEGQITTTDKERAKGIEGADLFNNFFKKYSSATISRTTNELEKKNLIKIVQNNNLSGRPKTYYMNLNGLSKFTANYIKETWLGLTFKKVKISKELIEEKKSKEMIEYYSGNYKYHKKRAEQVELFLNSWLFENFCYSALWSGVSNLKHFIVNVVNIILNIWSYGSNESYSKLLKKVRPEFKEIFKAFIITKKEINSINSMKLDLFKYELNIGDYLTTEYKNDKLVFF